MTCGLILRCHMAKKDLKCHGACKPEHMEVTDMIKGIHLLPYSTLQSINY